MPRFMSPEGLNNLIKNFESCRLQAYKCPAGVWTIGYGSTKWLDGRPVKPGQSCSPAQAEALLKRDIAATERFVDARLAKTITKTDPSGKTHAVPVPQWCFDAAVSLAYNIGEAAWAKSSELKKINAGDFVTFAG